ncbi:MAG TPA: sugar ABC transporter substrate-binding protein [Clostridiales bacterium]|nr:sugar ABC transporter substrate-binding protein [Clostridiales bacterium]
MRSLRCLIAGLLIVIVCLSAAACKGPSTSGTNGDSSGQQQVTLKFTFWGSPVEKQAVENAIKKFEDKYKYIKVDALHIPTDYQAKITAMLAGNEAPDVAYLSDTLCLEWAQEGKLVNVLEYMKNDPELKEEDHLESVWYRWAPDKALGTNTAVEAYALFYNKDMFEEAGAPLPPTKPEDAWSWDEFVEVAKMLTKDGSGKHPGEDGFDKNNIVQYGVQYGTGINSWMNAVYSNGGRFIKPDGSSTALTEPEAIEAIQKIADLMNVHYVCPSPVAAKNIPEISTALMTKKVAMVITGQWVLLDLAANKSLNFDIGVMPVLKEYKTVILGGATAIFESSKHKDEAWLLYKWLNNPESSLELHAGGLWMPLLKNWYTDPELVSKWAENNPAHPASYKDAVMRATLEYGMSGPAYNVKNYGKISAIVTPALDQVWLGEKTAEEALKEVESQINELVDGFYNSNRDY